MACESCGEKKEHKREFPSAVVEINNPERLVLLRKVVIPASMGDETAVPASVGKYRNVVLQYEVNKHVYLYSSDGIPTLIDTQIPQEMLDRIDALEDEDVHLQQEIDDLKNSPDVVDIVATYEDLMDYDTSKLGDKDVIRVLTDETHDNESSYYRWDKTNNQWVFIGAVEGYYTKAQTDDLLDEKQDTLIAGANISIDSNNVISATDTTYSDFVGTDGTVAGSAGLVPAPAITDAGKFLSASGLWEEVAAGGGGVTELTSADYNYPTDNPTTIATWLLQPGIYHNAQGVKTRFAAGESDATDSAYWFIGEVASGSTSLAWYKIDGDSFSNIITGTTNNSTGAAVDSWKRYLTTAAIVQTTGASTTSVMSQNATTSMVYKDPSVRNQIQIGNGAEAGDGTNISIGFAALCGGSLTNGNIAIGRNSSCANRSSDIAIGDGAYSTATSGVAIGPRSKITNGTDNYSVALGAGAKTSTKGELNIGTSNISNTAGYNDTAYRLISDVYDGQSAHDAATKGQLDGVVLTNAGAPTTSTVGTVGQLLEDTTNGKLYICTDATNPYVWEEVGSGGGGGSAMVELTSADYNYHSTGSTDDGVALWLLPAGEYYIASNTNYYIRATSKISINVEGTSFKIWKTSSGTSLILVIGPGGMLSFYKISSTGSQIDYVYYLDNNAVVQSTGTSTALVMSQNATTSMIYADPSTRVKVQIGSTAAVTSRANNGVAIGSGNVSATAGGIAIGNAWNPAQVSGNGAIAIGSTTGANVSGQGSISLGAFTPPNTTAGVIEVGSTQTTYGYNSSNYRLLTGLYDPQTDHDAATKGYVDGMITLTDTDPGEGAALAAGKFIAVYDSNS